MLDALYDRFAQRGMYVVVALFAILLYLYGIFAVVMGWWPFLAAGLLVISPIARLTLSWLYEDPSDRSLIDPSAAPWGLIVGALAALFFAFWFAGRGWHSVPVTPAQVLGTTLSAAAFGVAAAYANRRFNTERCNEVGCFSSLYCPTKVWNDFVVVPVVAALMFWLLMPQFVLGMSADTVLALVSLAVFGGLMAVAVLSLPGRSLQYPDWDAEHFSPAHS